MGTDELLTYDEAAAILQVSVRTINVLIHSGNLTPVGTRFGGYRKVLHRDVIALAEARRNCNSPMKVLATALRSEAKASSLEKRLTAIESLLGVHVPALPKAEPEIVELYARARLGIEDPPHLEADVTQWAMILAAMNEEFLETVVAVTSDEEAWRVFANFARAVSGSKPIESFYSDKRLEAAYGYFEYARRCLEGVLFLHVQRTYDTKTATTYFRPVADNPHEHIIRLVILAGITRT